jgi:hypothetical protein
LERDRKQGISCTVLFRLGRLGCGNSAAQSLLALRRLWIRGFEIYIRLDGKKKLRAAGRANVLHGQAIIQLTLRPLLPGLDNLVLQRLELVSLLFGLCWPFIWMAS